MKQRYLRVFALAALAAALWPALCPGAGAEAAEAVPEEPAEAVFLQADELAGATFLQAGELAGADLGQFPAFEFTAPSGGVYDAWLFPAGDAPLEARAELWQGGELAAVGEGTMPAISLRLTAGASYILRLSGSGMARVEIARHALSRCFAMPMALEADGDSYAKAFARPGDAHWYAVDADSDQSLALTGVPSQPGLRLRGLLFDDAGRLLAEAAQTPGGACLMDFTPEPGRRYLFRLTALDGATGLYALGLKTVGGAAEALSLRPRELVLSGRAFGQLAARRAPKDADAPIYWESSDPSVARVDANGLVAGVGGGEATITAYAAGGASAGCRVTVRYVPVASISLLSRRMALCAGDDAAIECDVQPVNASDPRLEYETRPEGVVEVDGRGVLRALSEGEATVTVRARDGGMTDALTVVVKPAPRRWRALLVGEQNYASTVASVRTGSVNSVAGLRSMLEGLTLGDAKPRVSTLLDASRDGVLAAVAETFAGAGEQDVSLFYITCHGGYSGGMTYLKMYDGSVLSAAELAAALRQIRGEVFVIIDCCGSGGALARASETGDILKGIDAVFGGVVGPPVLGGSRFRVLASAALEQDSYRISFSDAAAESDMATVFARALCEAGGWSLDRSARSALRADADYDGAVTLNELYLYTARRVLWYLRLAGGTDARAQSVQVWPEDDGTVVFER